MKLYIHQIDTDYEPMGGPSITIRLRSVGPVTEADVRVLLDKMNGGRPFEVEDQTDVVKRLAQKADDLEQIIQLVAERQGWELEG